MSYRVDCFAIIGGRKFVAEQHQTKVWDKALSLARSYVLCGDFGTRVAEITGPAGSYTQISGDAVEPVRVPVETQLALF